MRVLKYFSAFLLASMVSCHVEEEEDAVTQEEVAEDVVYVTPDVDPKVYFAEHFDHLDKFEQKWIKSSAKKDGAEADIEQ